MRAFFLCISHHKSERSCDSLFHSEDTVLFMPRNGMGLTQYVVFCLTISAQRVNTYLTAWNGHFKRTLHLLRKEETFRLGLKRLENVCIIIQLHWFDIKIRECASEIKSCFIKKVKISYIRPKKQALIRNTSCILFLCCLWCLEKGELSPLLPITGMFEERLPVSHEYFCMT